MTVKTITYKRILNLGNYESKHLEMSANIDDGESEEFINEECSRLMDLVESKIREEASIKIEEDIASARKLLRELKAEYEGLKELMNPPNDLPDFEDEESDF